MKKIIYICMVLGLVLTTACDPMDDIHAEFDAMADPIVGGAEYTLTDEDYDDLDLSSGNFSSVDDAKSIIPAFLSEKYPVWGKGSAALVHYQLFMGYPVNVRGYNLDQADYTSAGSDLLGFASDAKPEEFLPAIISDGVSSSEGKYAVAKYYQFTGDAYSITPTVLLEENYDYGAVAGDLTAITNNWGAHSGAGSLFVGYDTSGLSMTGYPSSGVGGSATITPSNREDVYREFTPVATGTVYLSGLINLSTVGFGTYFFHLKDDAFNYRARMGAKDNGSGKILFGIGASSSSLTYGTTAYDLNTTYLVVGSYNIDTGVANLHVLTTPEGSEPTTPEATNSGSSGTTISMAAFRQDGDGVEGPTAIIDGVRVANTWSAIMSNETLDDEVIGEKAAKEAFYMYSDGAWGAPADRFYFVSDADFNSMGEGSGEPGADDTFGSSIPPSNYLAVFLNLKFPYAEEGDELDVAYDYDSSSSGKQVRGDLYTFTDGEWLLFASVQSTSLQFGHDGSNWVPDNTIKYFMLPADYDYIVETFGSKYSSETANLAAFGNFNGFSWTFDMIDESIGAVLLHNFPNAAEGQKYIVTYSIYDGSTHDSTTSLILEGGIYVPF